MVFLSINTYSQITYYWMFDWETGYTPTGESISVGVLKSQYELSEEDKQASEDYWLDQYGNRPTVLSEATREYNCHGYAWYVSEGKDNVWISTPDDDAFWTTDTYL